MVKKKTKMNYCYQENAHIQKNMAILDIAECHITKHYMAFEYI